MHIVTGGFGFIGSNLVHKLVELGETVIVVDDLSNGHKIVNLDDCPIEDYIDFNQFRTNINAHKNFGKIDAIFHLGACSDTTEWDGSYMLDNNYQYSKELYQWAEKYNIPFIYASSASVYGDGKRGFSEEVGNEKPLNVYAYSKWLFDQWVRQRNSKNQVIGIRYFNVYGLREQHKGHMASVVWHLMQQVKNNQKMKLFDAYDGYKAGMQLRDFIYVEDAVNMNIWFWQHPEISGIFNCGTGKAEPFLNFAKVIKQQFKHAQLEFIPFPEHLKKAYQSYTQADLSRLTKIGFEYSFKTVEQGVLDYIQQIMDSE